MKYKSKYGKRKIRRSKSLYGNKRNAKVKSIIALIVTLIAAGVLVFLGYSIGEPLFNYIKNGAGNISSETPWTPSEVVSETGESSDTSGTSETLAIPLASGWSATELEADDLMNLDTLKSAVSEAKLAGYKAIVVPLKAEGGKVYYSTSAQIALDNPDIVSSPLSADEINAVIKNENMLSFARISVLDDNLAPKTTKSASYLFENSDSSWYDNSVENGGKPWLSPFSDTTKGYVMTIRDEVAAAGFDGIIASGVVFPNFRNSDLDYIGEIVKSPTRYKALVDTANLFSGSTPVSMVEVSASKVIAGTEEVYKPSELSVDMIIVNVNFSEFGNTLTYGGNEVVISGMSLHDKTKAIMEGVKSTGGDAVIVPKISSSDLLNTGDAREAVTALVDMGYTMYIID